MEPIIGYTEYKRECNLISEVGVKHLIKNNWRNLKIIDLGNNHINELEIY